MFSVISVYLLTGGLVHTIQSTRPTSLQPPNRVLNPVPYLYRSWSFPRHAQSCSLWSSYCWWVDVWHSTKMPFYVLYDYVFCFLCILFVWISFDTFNLGYIIEPCNVVCSIEHASSTYPRSCKKWFFCAYQFFGMQRFLTLSVLNATVVDLLKNSYMNQVQKSDMFDLHTTTATGLI